MTTSNANPIVEPELSLTDAQRDSCLEALHRDGYFILPCKAPAEMLARANAYIDGFCADAQQIVDVHRHTIDANTVPILDCSCNLQLAANAIGCHCQEMTSKFNQSAKTTRQVNRCSRCSSFSCRTLKRTDERSDSRAFKIDIDAA